MASRIPLPPPLALAKLVDSLRPVEFASPVWEPKWDGYRAVACNGQIWSRRGTDLTQVFPDVGVALSRQVPADVVLDGEIVVWDPSTGRLDFDALQSRMTAGRRLAAMVADRPAHYVAFDLLADATGDLRPRPLRERRQVLESVLALAEPPLAVCQQSNDETVAREWLATLVAAGIEGVVIKDADGPYPLRDDRVWRKVKAKVTLDLVAVGFTGQQGRPTSLILSFPAAAREGGTLATAGSTTVLSDAAARAAAPFLRPTGETFDRVFAWGRREPTRVHVIEPLVVEVSADAASTTGKLRHSAKLLRVRPDLRADELGVDD